MQVTVLVNCAQEKGGWGGPGLGEGRGWGGGERVGGRAQGSGRDGVTTGPSPVACPALRGAGTDWFLRWRLLGGAQRGAQVRRCCPAGAGGLPASSSSVSPTFELSLHRPRVDGTDTVRAPLLIHGQCGLRLSGQVESGDWASWGASRTQSLVWENPFVSGLMAWEAGIL